MGGLHRPRLLGPDDEWFAVSGDAVDGVEQLSHSGDERELGRLAGGAAALALAGLAEAGHDADIGREGSRAAEPYRIADGGDDAGGRVRADPLDAGEQPPDLVGVEQALDVALDLGESPAPELEVLADMARLQRVDRSVMLADRAPGRVDELARESVADLVAAVLAELREPLRAGTRERLCRGIFGEQAGGEHAVEAADVAGELREAEIDQAVELARPVVEVWRNRSRWRTSSRRASATASCSRMGAGRFSKASRIRPAASIASILVRARLASWKRRAGSGLISATSCPAATSVPKRFFQ